MSESASTDDRVLLEQRGPVALITLNDPSTLNAMNTEMFMALRGRLEEVGEDDSCSVVVLTGAGRSFCSGKDMRVAVDPHQTPTERLGEMRRTWKTVTRMREIQQPIIAAVRGHAVGVGFAFAAAADLRVVAPDAKFNPVFARIGMTPGDMGLSWFLPKIIGIGRAAEAFNLAKVIDADTAERWGLANEIAEDPVERALELADQMSELSPESLRQTKELLNASFGGGSLEQHMEIEIRSQAMISFSRDHRQALDRFSSRG
ncbi:enoyl-CoA hydratase/isomerase family protein [Brevibacterium atlanticum]|uniref:enoyl-CoA hydratase/isomerase family protein n=1 Tax=Brevibacterium atlanticum TaxID=2697563 RepID=UPI001421F31C|nr:enoyl-CoA hydratase/isomerase family protein [Brevibacterium atlanticum]